MPRAQRSAGDAWIIARSAASLYGQQISNALLPLILVSFLARVLSSADLGLYFLYSNLSVWLYYLVEYGFNLSATRQVSQCRDSPAKVAHVASTVVTAQVVLVVLVLSVVLAVVYAGGLTTHQASYLAAAAILGVGRGVSPFWYFQGTERLAVPTLLDIGGRTVAVAAAVFLVRHPSDGHIPLICQAICSMIVSSWQMAIMLRHVRLVCPTLASVLSRFRDGFGACVYRLAGATYVTTSLWILAAVASPATVGHYGGAERITRGLLTFVAPICSALYPRLSLLTARADPRAGRITGWALVSLTLVGMVAWVTLAGGSELWVRVLLGTGHGAADRLLDVLAVQAPLVALSTALAVVALLPRGAEGVVNAVLLTAAVLTVVLGLRYGAWSDGMGMAWVAVAVEGFVAIALLAAYGALPGRPRK